MPTTSRRFGSATPSGRTVRCRSSVATTPRPDSAADGHAETTGHDPDIAPLCRHCDERAEIVDCDGWDFECLTCHVTRCRACQDDMADEAAAEIANGGRWV